MLSEMKIKSDVIVLGETKLKTNFPVNLYHLNGYKMHHCSRKSKISGGGLLVYVKKEIIVNEVVKSSSSHEKIKLKIKIEGIDLCLLSYYRQPLSSALKPFMDDLEDELRRTDTKMIIIGDVNINAKPDSSDSADYINLLTSYDMIIKNVHQTRNASGRIIDHLASNFDTNMKIRNFTITNSISDHNAILTQLTNWKSSNSVRLVKFERTNFNALRQHFKSFTNTSSILNNNDPDEISNALINAIDNSLKKSTKTVKYKIKSDLSICHWYNEHIIRAIKLKDTAARKWRRNKSSNYFKLKLRSASRRLRQIIKIEKQKYISRCAEEKNPKKLWRNLNEILGRSIKDEIRTIKVMDKMVHTDLEMSNAFNNFFVDSIKSLSCSLHDCLQRPQLHMIQSSMVLESTDDNEVLSVINGLKSSAAPGIDGISTKHIKELRFIIAPFFTHLVNKIFETGTFPKNLKTAIVIPINKSGDSTNLADYRPISILPVASKIIEKIMLNRLIDYTNHHLNIIYPYQFGFRSKCNAEIAALELTDFIRTSINDKKVVSAVMMDIRRAFDAVNIERLLDSLQHLGIRNNALKLLESFLLDRCQVVRINDSYSNKISFSQGVVQGSILGPWLFVLFINHISNLKLNGKLILFADDCVLINTHERNEPIEEKIRSDMKSIINFLNYQKLTLNADKTFFMIFRSSNMKLSIPDEILIKNENNDVIKISGAYVIKRATKIKYLGLFLDETLSFSDHIKHVETKLSSASGILWKLRRQLPQHIKKKIYQSLFETHLSYMINVWGTASDDAIKYLQVIQNRALRNVYDLDRMYNRVDMYKNQVDGCLPLRGLLFQKLAVFILNILSRNIHSNMQFERTGDGRTRDKKSLKLSKAKTMYGRKSVKYMGVKIYNSLPQEIKTARHIYSAKWLIKAHIRETSILDSCFNGQFLQKFT